MSFRTRSASLGELHGGQRIDLEPNGENLERSKSFRHITKNGYGVASKTDTGKKKLFRKPSVKSLTQLVQRVVFRVSTLNSENGSHSVPSFEEDRSRLASLRRSDLSSTDSDNDRGNILYSKPGESPGLTGIKNHGNTCFMNAVVQCLSHTDLLAEYFVLDHFKNDLKKKWRLRRNSGRFGTKGEVTEKLALLVKSLWTCNYSYELSSEFREIVGKYGSQYRGFAQHDAQEFLLWLLDKVHEDLNRVTKRKYKPVKDLSGRSDDQIACDMLASHNRCNDSYILDVFQAQYRSSLTCPQCQIQSTTFDPFLCLSLPIPQQEMRPLYLTYVPFTSSPRYLRIGVSVPISGTIGDVRTAVADITKSCPNSLALCELCFDGLHRTFLDDQPLDTIPDLDNLYAFECPSCLHPPDESSIDGVHSQLNLELSSNKETLSTDSDVQETILILLVNCQGSGKNMKRFGPIHVLRVLRELSYSDLQQSILELMSSMLSRDISQQVKSKGTLFRLRVVNGLPGKCYLSPEVDHPLYQAAVNRALQNCQGVGGGAVHIKLIAEWDSDVKAMCISSVPDITIFEDPSVQDVEAMHLQPQIVQLQDCFRLYTRDEKLGSDDAWLCPNCKKLQQGTIKRLSLWSLPDVLVIHLKRFKQTATGRTKLHTLVEFPIHDLDMTNHLEPRKVNMHYNHFTLGLPSWRRSRASSVLTNDDNIYDLFAVCNHLGNMTGGHYTAFACNSADNKWYLFDDKHVEPITEDRINTRAAYLLFYARRNLGSSSGSVSSVSTASSEHWIHKVPGFSFESLTTSQEECSEDDSSGFHHDSGIELDTCSQHYDASYIISESSV